MFISSLVFRVKPDKRAEFLGAIEDLMERARWFRGCFGCRLLAELEAPHVLTLVAEWGDRAALDQFLGSNAYRVLLGMRILTEEPPAVTIDEVSTRTRLAAKELSS